MTAVSLAPAPEFKAFDNNGFPLLGGLLYTYIAGTSTPQATYIDSTGTTPNTNPVVLNARGEASVWLATALTYKLVLTDALGNQIWSVDQISGGQSLTQAAIGALLYPQTAAEIAAGVTPTNYSYPGYNPRRYGATGNGTTDDTAAMNQLIAVLNASPGVVSTWQGGDTYYCTTLNNLTAANITLNCYATILSKPVTSYVYQLSCTGANVTIRGLTINGNQSAFASSYCSGLLLAGNNPTLEDCAITQCSANGLVYDSINFGNTTLVGGLIQNVTINQCAAAGYYFDNVSYLTVINMIVEKNGWGFQAAGITQPGGSFGGSTRFRSHHVTFIGCSSLQNGLDGFNTNQGAYALKYQNCLAWMNGDGGFTIAGDNTSTGRPGEGEFSRDGENIDCESYNNWGAGLIGETTVYNWTVLGGRYYNNGRGVGTRTQTPTMTAGVSWGSQGSLGLNIQTKCYDDRQIYPITAQSGGVVTATGWGVGSTGAFVATAAYYPRVAFYNASMVFQGYGTITAESSGSVTVATTANNGVTIASIVSGWIISQRTQHTGCYFATGNQGQCNIDGFGTLPGVGTDQGQKVISYSAASGQNIRNVNPQLRSSVELLSNPSFDSGIGSGTSWTYTLTGGGTATAYTTAGEKLYSPGGLVLAGGTSNATADAILITSANNYAVDCWFEVSCIVYAVAAGDGGIVGYYNAGVYSTQVAHPGGGTKLLTVSGYLIGANTVNLRLYASAGKSVWFDEASVKVKFEPLDQRDYSYPTRNIPY